MWQDWERERAPYEYGRRHRSRSPPYDDVGRKRRRSPSPYDRDRYDPRPRYDEHSDAYRGYGHSPPRSRGYSSRSSRPPPPDPYSMDLLASLKQYAEWFRHYYPQQANEEDQADKAAELEAGDGSKPRNGIKARWEKYKKEFLAQQLQTLFDHHRKSPWFSEKYEPSPEFANLRNRVRKVGWRGRMNLFLNELEDGKFDHCELEQEITSQVKAENTSAENTGLDEPEQQHKNEDKFGMGMEAEDDNAENAGDVKNDANGKSSYETKQAGADEVSVEPEGNQIMIRTIPPDIGRVKLEAVIKDIPGFVYLALGDPMQKRSYYRAGWIRFTEDADIAKVLTTLSEQKIEGFKLHVSHNTRPFTSKARVAPESASRPDRIAKDLEQAKQLVAILEEEYERVRSFRPELPSAGDSTSKGAKDQTDEEHTDSPPAEDILTMDALAVEEEPREKGSDAIERRLTKIYSELPEPASDGEAKALDYKKNTIALDLYLAYLRFTFHTCYYCVSTSDHLEELQRKCIKHVRKPLSKHSLTEIEHHVERKLKDEETDVKLDEQNESDEIPAVKEEEEKGKDSQEKPRDKDRDTKGEPRDWKRNDERWLETLDNKIALLINKDGIDVRDYGGKRYEDELSKAVEPHIKQEDEGKFRCRTCSKLFKATSFVEKHVVNKHPELIKQLDDLTFYNNFALDPQRIQPFTHFPQPTGNGPAVPPQAYGFRDMPQPYPDPSRGVPPGVMPAPYYPYHPAYPPPYANGGYPEPHGFYPYSGPMALPARSLRDEAPLMAGGRRLGDRIGGFAPPTDQQLGHGIEGLPAKPVATLEPGPGGRKNGRAVPPPPPDAKEDPRAAAGKKVSYHDMDLVAEGDVELMY